MAKTPVKIKSVLFFLLAGLMVLTMASGYLYRENKTYQNENHRLIILNDSILSENIELKNYLQQKQPSAAFKGVPETLKTKGNK